MPARLAAACLLGSLAVGPSVFAAGPPAPADPAAPAVRLEPMDAGEARTRTLAWLESRRPTNRSAVDEVLDAWEVVDGDPRRTLKLAVRTYRLGSPAVDEFVAACVPGKDAPLPDFDAVLGDVADPFVADNLAVWYGRFLTREGLYDEGLFVLENVPGDGLIDPAALLFHRAVCQQQLLERDAAVETLAALLAHTGGVPQSHRALAELMRHDLEETKPESLREVSSLMRDVERRLDFGRTGPQVRRREDAVVAKLDAIIEKLEAQSGGGGGGGGQGGQNGENQAQNAADASRVKGNIAPGEVDEKQIAGQGGWGDLPEKEQVRAKNLLNRRFPGHYERVIERYFNRGAEERP